MNIAGGTTLICCGRAGLLILNQAGVCAAFGWHLQLAECTSLRRATINRNLALLQLQMIGTRNSVRIVRLRPHDPLWTQGVDANYQSEDKFANHKDESYLNWSWTLSILNDEERDCHYIHILLKKKYFTWKYPN